MRDYLNIGSSPYGENCFQVGSENYYENGRKECLIYKRQLIRQFGDTPQNSKLQAKSFPHDFGSYWEVVCWFDDQDKESVDYAFKLESEGPENWDDEAKQEYFDCFGKFPE